MALNKRVNAFALSKFAIATVGLNEAAALAFQLDLFLASPHESIFRRGIHSADSPRTTIPSVGSVDGVGAITGSALERRVYNIIMEAGGSAIVEPPNSFGSAAPDLLMWLPQQEPSLLDPAAIEVKEKAVHQIAKKVEKHLLSFMQAGGVQSGILLTHEEARSGFRSTAPNFFWLSIDNFEQLLWAGNLGRHLREMRNRAAHGAP